MTFNQPFRAQSRLMRLMSLLLSGVLMLSILIACGEETTEVATEPALAENPTEVVEVVEDTPLVEATTVATEVVIVEEEPTEEPTEEIVVDTPEVEATDPITDASGATENIVLNSLDEITADPGAFIGQQVAVQGDVNVVTGPSSFSIADNTLLDLNEVLVVGVPEGAVTVSEDLADAETPVIVEGTVQILSLAEIDPAWGFDDTTEIEVYENRPIIVADNVQFDRTGLSIEQVLEDPEVYAGQQVTLAAYVNEGVAGDAFTMAEHTFFDVNNILVVTPDLPDSADQLYSGQPIRVRGTLELVNADLLEDRLAGLDLDENTFNSFTGKPVLIAEQVWVAGAEERLLDDITEDPQAWYGRQVTVAGEVNVFKSETLFSIATVPLVDENEILIIALNDQVVSEGIEDGAEVTVTGTVRRMVIADIERDFGIDFDPEIEAEFVDKPVIIATSVAGSE